MDTNPMSQPELSECPSMGVLFDYVAGESGERQAQSIARHLGRCNVCRATVESLEKASFALVPQSREAVGRQVEAGAVGESAGFRQSTGLDSAGDSLNREGLREVLRSQLLGESKETAGTTRIQALSDDLDGACDTFESEWIAGGQPRIEQFLAEAAPADQASLLYELVRLDLYYRREHGERPLRAEYLSRFPNQQQTLDSIDFGEDDVEAATAAPLSVQLEGDTAEFGTEAQPTVRREPEPLRYLGHFALLERIGGGGFGTVWRATDTHLNRIVAVKVPGKESLDSDELERFLNEARSAARLRHPNIVAVHAVCGDPPVPYIVTDYVEGVSLREWLNARRMSFQEAAYCCSKLGHALHHAHERGIIHRDIKPENVLVDSALEPHLADFGLAKQEHVDVPPETVGAVFGTPAYMSPEQARGEGAWATRATDIYSLGALLYALLTGRPPFLGTASREILRQVIHNEPTFPAQDRKDSASVRPIDLEMICLKALSKRTSNRYTTAEEFALDLERFLRHEPVRARQVSLLQRGKYWVRRNRLLTASLAVVLCLGLALGLRPATRHGKSAAARSRVLVATNPAGATLALVPLSADGKPDPERLISPSSKSPCELDLDAGDYLVVASVEKHGFHEVYRHVPRDGELIHGFYHRHSRRNEQGVLEWQEITIPNDQVTKGMALFNTGDETSGATSQPPVGKSLPSFYLDETEFTIGDLRRSGKNVQLPPRLRDSPPPDDFAASNLSYFEAMSLAEAVGKRLPDEIEYQHAATSGGKQNFPWGDSWKSELGSPRTSGPVRYPPFDRVEIAGQPPVFGLYSNVAEWTSSGFSRPNIGRHSSGRELEMDENEILTRKVWGWDHNNFVRKNDGSKTLQGSFAWQSVNMKTFKPQLGFRCARSASPRLRPEDFTGAPVRSVAGMSPAMGGTAKPGPDAQ